MLSSTLGDQVDGLVDTSQGGDINCLFSHNTTCTDSGGILSRSCLQQGSNKHLQRVLACKEVDDFEGVSDDSDGFGLLTSVSAVELEGSNETFNNGAECLSELFGLVSSGGVRDEDLGFDGLGCDVVDEAGVFDLGRGVCLL